MNRRVALVGSGAVLATAIASRTDAEANATGSYDITLGVQPGKKGDEFLCQVSLRSGESGRIYQQDGFFKRGTTGTVRTGEGRPDGSAIDLTVDVTVDTAGERAEFIAKVSDRGKLVSIQRTSVQLPRV
jgi:hypothetical protein